MSFVWPPESPRGGGRVRREGGAVGCLKESTTKYITPPFARRAFGRWEEEVVVVVYASKEILQRQEIRKKKAPHSSVGSVGSAVAI